MDTLISGVTIVTMNEKMDVLFGAYLGIQDGKIAYIGKTPPEGKPQTILDGTGMVAMPGLINCHTHLATSALRNLLDDTAKAETLQQVLSRQDKLDNRSAKAAAQLAIAECLRFGITSVSDLYYFPEATAQAVAESGIKANLSLSSYRFIDPSEDFDFESDEQCRELVRLVDTWHGYDNDRIKIDAGFYAEYTSNYRLWEALADFAEEKALRLQFHLSQTAEEVASCEARTGLTPAELLNCHRVFSRPVTAATCAHLTDQEQKMLGKAKVSAVATPIASAKQGLSATPITACVKAGMNVALGTGGAVECGNLDLFETMRFAALQQRQEQGEATALPAAAVLMMATVCGATAQGRSAQCGMLKEGMDADIVLVDFSAPHLMPCHDVPAGLVFSAKGGDVAMTMVRGRILYQNGKFFTLDLNAIVSEIMEYAIPKLLGSE